jgi:hypothetical protein
MNALLIPFYWVQAWPQMRRKRGIVITCFDAPDGETLSLALERAHGFLRDGAQIVVTTRWED